MNTHKENDCGFRFLNMLDVIVGLNYLALLSDKEKLKYAHMLLCYFTVRSVYEHQTAYIGYTHNYSRYKFCN